MFVPISIWTVVLQCCILTIHATQKSVLLYSTVNPYQLVTSTTLIWQSYTGDEKDLEFAVRAAKYSSDEESYQQYVCRVIIEGIFVPGHTQKRDERTLCIVSMHMDVRTHHIFDVLLNKGNGAKISWKPWNKFSATIPGGAVSATSSGHVSLALKKNNHKHYVKRIGPTQFLRMNEMFFAYRWMIIMLHVENQPHIVNIIITVSIIMSVDMRQNKVWARSLLTLTTAKR